MKAAASASMSRPSINVHAHLFTADHSPEVQFYYMLRDVMSAEGRLAGWIDTIQDYRLWWTGVKTLLSVLRAVLFVCRWVARRRIKHFADLVSTVSMVNRAALARMFGAKAGKLSSYHVVSYLLGAIRDWDREAPGAEISPLAHALKKLASEVYAAHRKASTTRTKTQKDLLDAFLASVRGSAPLETLVVLSMNFDSAFVHAFEPHIKATPDVSFHDQANELLRLCSSSGKGGIPRLIPFLCVDPRASTPGSVGVEVDAENWLKLGFRGIKVYAPLGYLVEDARLEKLFEYCMKNQVPVLSHGGIGGAGRKGALNCDDLAHPYYWVPVLDRLEDCYKRAVAAKEKVGNYRFKLCLAHFGGSGPMAKKRRSWWDEVLRLMDHYKNSPAVELYTDIAFNLPNTRDAARRYCRRLRRLASSPVGGRLLFGCDWWMYLYVCDVRDYYQKVFRKWRRRPFRDGLTFAECMDANARRYLGIP